jgi:hypothetical protein
MAVHMQAWSSWNTFRENVSDALLLSTASALVSSGLHAAGYSQVWIDDGWSVCSVFNADGSCQKPGPRDASGCIVPDPAKFPRGIGPLAANLAASGIVLGIYTAISSRTCGGFWGSLNNEAVDAACFVSWGIRAIKEDTCNTDCPITCVRRCTCLCGGRVKQHIEIVAWQARKKAGGGRTPLCALACHSPVSHANAARCGRSGRGQSSPACPCAC